jgi:prevent-host-death family protein
MVKQLVYYSTMITINVHEAKTRLSHYLDEVAKGETVVICKRNRPLAEIRPLPASSVVPRPIGLAKGTFTIPVAFFEPLPDDVLRDFEGRDVS